MGGMFNLFSGGALEQLSIFALGIMPYVSASIILSIMSAAVPTLHELQREGESGQRKINQYTRYGTVALSIVQSIGISMFLEGLNASEGCQSGVGFSPANDDLPDHRHRVHHVVG